MEFPSSLNILQSKQTMDKHTAIALITLGHITDESQILNIGFRSYDEEVIDLVIKTLDLGSKTEQELFEMIKYTRNQKMCLKVLKFEVIKDQAFLVHIMKEHHQDKDISREILRQISFSTLTAERQYEILKKSYNTSVWEAVFEGGLKIDTKLLISLATKQKTAEYWLILVENSLVVDADELLSVAKQHGVRRPLLWAYYIDKLNLATLAEYELMELIDKTRSEEVAAAALRTGNINNLENIERLVVGHFRWNSDFVSRFVDLESISMDDIIKRFWGADDLEFWLKVAKAKGILTDPDKMLDLAGKTDNRGLWQYIADQKMITDTQKRYELALKVISRGSSYKEHIDVVCRMLDDGLTTNLSQLLELYQKSSENEDIEKYLDAECQRQLPIQTT